MDFVSIAQRACARQEYVRAVITLARGLKRQDDVDDAALDFLVETYANHCSNPGVEREVAQIVARHPDGAHIGSRIVTRLDERGHLAMHHAFTRQMREMGCPVRLLEPEVVDPEPSDEDRHSFDVPASRDTLPDIPALPDVIRRHESTHPEISHEEESVAEVDDTIDDGASAWGDEEMTEPEEMLPLDASSGQEDDDDAFEDEPHIPFSFGPPSLSTSTDILDDPSPSVHQRKGDERSRPATGSLRHWWGIVGSFLAIIIIGAIGWVAFSKGAHVEAIEHHVRKLDVVQPEPFHDALSRIGERDDAVMQRATFARTVLAYERDDASSDHGQEPEDPIQSGVWVMGTHAFASMKRGDIERAIYYAELLERTHPDEMVTLWVQARLLEKRGKLDEASLAWREAMQRFDSFVPALMGGVRVAWMRGESEELRLYLDELSSLNPLHPYLAIDSEPVALNYDYLGLDIAPWQDEEERETGGGDRFLRAYRSHVSARRAWHARDMEKATSELGSALALLPYASPCVLLRTAVAIMGGAHEEGLVPLDALLSREGLSVEFRLHVMHILPHLLTQVGRSDLAWVYTLDPPEDDTRAQAIEALDPSARERLTSMRPTSLDLSATQLDTHPTLVRGAHDELLETLLHWGALSAAQSALDAIEGRGPLTDDAKVARLMLAFSMGDEAMVESAAHRLGANPRAALAQSIDQLLGGDWDGALRTSAQSRSLMREHAFWLRTHVLALLMQGRGEDVLIALDGMRSAPPFDPALDRLARRARALEGLDIDSVDVEPLSSIEALLDAAAVHLWRGELERGEALIERVLARAPRHPEANWYAGLLHALQGNDRAAKSSLAHAGIASLDEGPVLITLGELLLRLDRNMQARELFYKAALRHDEDARALDGLGRSSIRVGTDVASRDLEHLLLAYSRLSHAKARTGSVLKWLGILHGSRKGVPEALVYLDRAILASGPRGDLLLEKGRYHAAARSREEAKRFFIDALRRDSTLADAHLELAKLMLREKEDGMAREHLRKYLDLRPYGPQSDWAATTLDTL